ncbi:MAG TPA: hypothetical protein VFY87_08865 [Geminicoccaceae bacterium]|nr:hypothetical protein [Geminicoccaceae bacterium]
MFRNLKMATAAALGGLGVAMADLHLVRDELSSGALVAPFDLMVTEETGYFPFAGQAWSGQPRSRAGWRVSSSGWQRPTRLRPGPSGSRPK